MFIDDLSDPVKGYISGLGVNKVADTAEWSNNRHHSHTVNKHTLMSTWTATLSHWVSLRIAWSCHHRPFTIECPGKQELVQWSIVFMWNPARCQSSVSPTWAGWGEVTFCEISIEKPKFCEWMYNNFHMKVRSEEEKKNKWRTWRRREGLDKQSRQTLVFKSKNLVWKKKFKKKSLKIYRLCIHCHSKFWGH